MTTNEPIEGLAAANLEAAARDAEELAEAAETARRKRIKAERDEAALAACMAFAGAGGDPKAAKELAWKAVALDEEYRAREY